MKISLINKSTVVSDSDIEGVAAALTLQVKQDWAPKWLSKVTVESVAKGQRAPSGRTHWPIRILDDSDEPGALGYHTYSSTGPAAKVFARTCIDDGVEWSGVASHELLELLADPQGVLAALDGRTGLFWAYEVCDPVEAWTYNIDDGDWAVSNFVYPNWFVEGSQGPWDFMQVTTGPLLVSKYNGENYAQKLDVTCSNGWQQITARQRDKT